MAKPTHRVVLHADHAHARELTLWTRGSLYKSDRCQKFAALYCVGYYTAVLLI